MARQAKGRKSRSTDFLPDHPTHQKGFRLSRGDRQFWLGQDKVTAEIRARSLDLAWQKIKSAGRKEWTDLEVQEAMSLAVRTPTAPPAPAPVPTAQPAIPADTLPPKPIINGLNLHQAIDAFSQHVMERNDLEMQGRCMIASRLASMKCHLTNDPLSSIGFMELDRYRKVIMARPLSRRQLATSKLLSRVKTPNRQVEAKKISIFTATEWLKELKDVLLWCKRTGRWRLPEGLDRIEFDDLFSLSKKQKRDMREDGETSYIDQPKPTPTLDELRVYYRAAVGGQRLFMLMGISLGWRQSQITDLKKDELVIENKEYYIRTNRTKTGTPINVWVCPELAALLLERMKGTPANHDNYAMLTQHGLPLTHISAGGNKTDAIGSSWDCLMRRVAKMGIPTFSFDSLRRFAGQCIVNKSDPYLAQVFLAHKPSSVLEQHYASRNGHTGIGTTALQKVHDVQKQVYAEVKHIFDDSQTLNDVVKAYKAARQPQTEAQAA